MSDVTALALSTEAAQLVDKARSVAAYATNSKTKLFELQGAVWAVTVSEPREPKYRELPSPKIYFQPLNELVNSQRVYPAPMKINRIEYITSFDASRYTQSTETGLRFSPWRLGESSTYRLKSDGTTDIWGNLTDKARSAIWKIQDELINLVLADADIQQKITDAYAIYEVRKVLTLAEQLEEAAADLEKLAVTVKS